jgi:DNA-binding NtrC family response regulator
MVPVHMIGQDRRVEDETIAGGTEVPILITASTRRDIERIARRIHLAGTRAAAPFVPAQVSALAGRATTLHDRCADLFDSAAGGTVLLTMAEDMSRALQDTLTGLFHRRRRTEAPVAARLITGTTVSLIDRVRAGTFSDRLFYQLNLIHLVATHGTRAAGSRAIGAPAPGVCPAP